MPIAHLFIHECSFLKFFSGQCHFKFPVKLKNINILVHAYFIGNDVYLLHVLPTFTANRERSETTSTSPVQRWSF